MQMRHMRHRVRAAPGVVHGSPRARMGHGFPSRETGVTSARYSRRGALPVTTRTSRCRGRIFNET
jgi:hypothetical protein